MSAPSACSRRERTYHSGVRSTTIAIALAWAASACGPATTTTAAPVRDYAGPLHAPSTYASDFAIDHQITAIHVQGSESFRALLEKHGDRLVMVGLAPTGSRAFTLTQEGDDVRFESQIPRELPFPARYMLIDVHRTWLVGLAQPLSDGTHETAIESGEQRETMIDVWADGRLVSRTFRRDGDTDDDPVLRIAYEGGLSPDPSAPSPSRIELDNGWFGYRLVMENISRSAL